MTPSMGDIIRHGIITDMFHTLEECDSKAVKWTWRRLLEQSFEIVGGEDAEITTHNNPRGE